MGINSRGNLSIAQHLASHRL